MIERLVAFIEKKSRFFKECPNNYRKVSYSQAGEDLIIQFIFNALKIKQPTFIDIGAHHPFYINNTYILYKNGSKGINIEPNPALYKTLRRYRRKDINLNVGIGDIAGETDFYVMSSPTMGTFDYDEALSVEQEDCSIKIVDNIKIEMKSLEEIICEYCNGEFPDFLSLDVEGLELQILRKIDFVKNYPKVICVETISYSKKGDGQKEKKIIEYIEKNGYLLYADTYINTIFVKENLWRNRL
jgi:FkbM family methyltransferase